MYKSIFVKNKFVFLNEYTANIHKQAFNTFYTHTYKFIIIYNIYIGYIYYID